MRFSGASPPRAPRPRSPGRAAARSARTRAVGPGGGNPPSGLRLLLDRGLERQLLLGGEQPRGVEDDDRAAVLHDEPRDVVSREPLDEAGRRGDLGGGELQDLGDGVDHDADVAAVPLEEDRKSTRLNSSHMSISYAVFCLKKKKKITYTFITLIQKQKNK